MAEITTRETSEQKIEVTPDYCFAQAAQALTYNPARAVEGGIEASNAWRELGRALLEAARG